MLFCLSSAQHKPVTAVTLDDNPLPLRSQCLYTDTIYGLSCRRTNSDSIRAVINLLNCKYPPLPLSGIR